MTKVDIPMYIKRWKENPDPKQCSFKDSVMLNPNFGTVNAGFPSLPVGGHWENLQFEDQAS